MDALFPGLAAMNNVHPLFVHFPIALFSLAFVFQAAALIGQHPIVQKLANCLLYCGALLALPTIVAGWAASSDVETLPGYSEAMDSVETIHSTFMFIVTGLGVALAIVALAYRRKMRAGVQWILFAGLLVLVILLGLGADRGGQLVYQYGVGTEQMQGGPPFASPHAPAPPDVDPEDPLR